MKNQNKSADLRQKNIHQLAQWSSPLPIFGIHCCNTESEPIIEPFNQMMNAIWNTALPIVASDQFIPEKIDTMRDKLRSVIKDVAYTIYERSHKYPQKKFDVNANNLIGSDEYWDIAHHIASYGIEQYTHNTDDTDNATFPQSQGSSLRMYAHNNNCQQFIMAIQRTQCEIIDIDATITCVDELRKYMDTVADDCVYDAELSHKLAMLYGMLNAVRLAKRCDVACAIIAHRADIYQSGSYELLPVMRCDYHTCGGNCNMCKHHCPIVERVVMLYNTIKGDINMNVVRDNKHAHPVTITAARTAETCVPTLLRQSKPFNAFFKQLYMPNSNTSSSPSSDAHASSSRMLPKSSLDDDLRGKRSRPFDDEPSLMNHHTHRLQPHPHYDDIVTTTQHIDTRQRIRSRSSESSTLSPPSHKQPRPYDAPQISKNVNNSRALILIIEQICEIISDTFIPHITTIHTQ